MESGTAIFLFICAQIIAAVVWAVHQHTKLSVLRERLSHIEEHIESNKSEIEKLRDGKHANANHIMRLQADIIQLRESIGSLSKRTG